MSFIIKQPEFTPAPAGFANAVCVDVTPIRMEKSKWGEKPKFRIVFEIDKKMDNGKPFLASKKYTPSLGDRATLRKDLKDWRGKEFTLEELKAFDLENVIGAPCNIVITHEESNEKIYANITAIIPAAGEKLKPTGKYVRIKDRPDYKPETVKSESHQEDAPDALPEDRTDHSEADAECPF